MKNQLYSLIFYLAMINFVFCDCNTGCLQCSTKGECKFCDFTNNYFLDNGECAKKELFNCLITSVDGTCLQCEEKYYFEFSIQKCRQVPLQIYVENCKYYSQNLSCTKCDSDYYISNNTCTLVEQKVENCIFYDSKNTCQECKDNYTLSFDKKSCEQYSDRNCLLSTSLKCTQCKTGYTKDNNFYANDLRYKAKNSNSIITAMNTFLKKQTFSDDICQLPKVYNCKRFLSFFECDLCEFGYYNLNGKCVQNPINKIANCASYKTINECQACVPGYFLENLTFCQSVEEIENCLHYDTSSHYTRCLICEEGYYLHTNNSCVKRVNIFEECLEYQLDDDKCKTCISSTVLTVHPNGSRCFERRQNCQEYFNDEKIEIPQCKNCIQGFYLKDDICARGSVKFCKEYERIENQCRLCENGYYLSLDRQCIENEEILNCEFLNPFRFSYCDQCNNQFILFQQTNKCQQIYLQNCKVAKNKTECFQCEDFYNLNQELQCEEGTILDCKIEKFNRCEKCQLGFALHKEKCVSIESYRSQQCNINNLNGLTEYKQYKCQQCVEYAEPINLKNNFVCLSKNEFQTFVPYQQIQNCIMHYRNFKGIVQCRKCAEGFMSHENGTCVLQCNTDINKWQFGQQNSKFQVMGNEMCTINNSPNCAVHSPLLIQDQTTLDMQRSCSECKNGYVKYIEYENEQTLISSEVVNDWPVLKTTSECIQDSDVINTDNCELYAMFPDDQRRCIKCNFQYSGIIKAWKVDHCRTYDYELKRCIECLPGYLLKRNADNSLHYHICVDEYTIVANCATLSYNNDRCYLCEAGYYLSDDGQSCTQFSITQCEILSHNSQTCDKCNDGYQLKSDQTQCLLVPSNCVLVNDSAVCTQCKRGYNLDSSKQCVSSDCYIYNKDYSLCLSYENKVFYTKTNQCVTAPFTLSNCIEYNQYRNCVQCTGHFYVSNGICVAATPEVINCKIYQRQGSVTVCTQCQDNHTLQTRDGNQYCVPFGQYVESDAFYSALNYSYQDLNCNMFDLDKWRCQSCDNSTYNSQGICCADNKVNINNKCQILSQITNCERIELFDNQYTCIQCASPFIKTKGICCASTQFNLNGSCVNLSDFNCSKWDYINNRCGTCISNYYTISSKQHCCNQGYYHTLTGCTQMANVAPYIDCLQFDIDNNQCIKCQDDYFFNGKQCENTTNHTDHCVLYQNSEYQNLCIQCESGYKLIDNICCSGQEYLDSSTNTCTAYTNISLIDNCNIMGESNNCQKCNNDYFLVNNNICCQDYSLYTPTLCLQTWNVASDYCALHDPQTLNCYYCLSDQTNEYYLSQNTNQQCCKEEQKYNPSTLLCEDIATLNCVQQNGTTCIKCAEGYFLNNNTCTQPISNCAQYDNTTCIKCKSDFLLYKSTAQNNTFCLSKSDFNFTLYQNCLELNYVSSLCTQGGCDDTSANVSTCYECYTCIKCTQYTYSVADGDRNICVDYGYQFLSQSKTQIHRDKKDCATYGYSTTEEKITCTECYYNSQYQHLYNDEQFLITPIFVNNRGFQHEQQFVLQSKNHFLEYEDNIKYLYNNNCVSQGNYQTDDQQVSIDIENCLMLDSNNKCIKCQSGYALHGDGMKCCRYGLTYVQQFNECFETLDSNCEQHQDENGNKYYTSNNHCCQEKQYWSNEMKRCVQNIDQNCLQSQDGIECQVCDTDYYKQKEFQFKAVSESFNMKSQNIRNFYQKLYLCIPSNKYTYAISQITDFQKLVSQVQIQKNPNCKIFNTQSIHKCEQCKEGYYQIQQSDICCAYGQVHLSYDNTYICSNINKNNLNCLIYDHQQKKCSICKNQYINYDGFCCNTFSYFDIATLTCLPKIQNCKIFDMTNTHCIQCNDEYYITNQKCCQLGYYYDAANNQCLQIQSKGIQNCQKLYKNKCVVCQDSYYLSNNLCCQLGYYDNNGTCQNINLQLGDNTMESGYFGCQILDQFQNCQLCQNSYLINGRCCQYEMFYNDQNANCVQGNINDCSIYDSFQNCTTCKDGYYLSDNTCTLNGQIKESDTYIYPKPSFQYLNIDHYNKYGEIVCIQDYNLQYTNATDLECKPILQTDPNCLKYSQQLPNTTCAICDSGYIPNGTSDPNNAETCSQFTMTGCEIIQPYQSGPPNQICERCEDGYMASYNNGQVDSCIQANFNCQYYVPNTTNCQLCDNNYYVDQDDSYNCKLISSYSGSPDFQNQCLIGEKTTGNISCLRCIQDYYPNNGTCQIIEQQRFVENCLYYKSDQNCDVCEANYYLNDNRCCHESISPSQCNDIVFRDIENCDRFASFEDGLVYCEKCKDGYYEVNDGCCQENQLFDGFECISITSNGLDQCLQYENPFECKQISQIRTENCMNGYYYIYQHCCQISKYWDFSQSQCVDIQQADCTQLDEDGICIECSASKYPSYGYCCDAGEYFNGKQCVTITEVLNCDQYDNGQCTQCSGGYDQEQGDYRCCSDSTQKYFWDDYNNACTLVHTNCNIFDFQNNICKDCKYSQTQTYLSELSCCPEGQYYNPIGKLCQAISTTSLDSTCNQVQPFNINLNVCQQCGNNGRFYNGKCCMENELNLIDYDFCLDNNFLSTCEIQDQKNSCLSCSNGYNLNEYQTGRYLCCPDGLLFDKVQNKCLQGIIEGCIHYQDSQNCLQCTDSRYLKKVNLDYDKCISNGYVDQNTFVLEHCIQFSNTSECLKCKDSFQLYKNTNSSKCCTLEQYYDEDISTECISISLLFQNCSNFDFNKMRCRNCDTDFVLSKHVCCPLGQVAVDGVCKTPSTIPSCLEYDINGQCIQCSGQYYVADGKCCPNNTIIDMNTKQCMPANDNCKVFTGYNYQICKECNSDSYMNSIGKCCLENQYWDEDKNSCKTSNEQRIINCKGLELIDGNEYCLGCKDNTFILAEDKTFCCQADQYLENGICVSATNVPKGCKKFDQDNLLCTECKEDYYYYKGKCVEKGLYVDKMGNKYTVGSLSINSISSCTGFDIDLGICIDCDDDQFLYEGYCVQKPKNCKIYDQYMSIDCQECEDPFYVTNGKCCTQGKYYDMVTDLICKYFEQSNLALNNCLESEHNQCIKCKEDYYLNNGHCCQENYYWNVENQQCEQNQDLLNCKYFGNSKLLCNQCESGYTLIKQKRGQSVCLQLPNITNCQDYEIDVDNNYRCSECQVTDSANYIIQEIAQGSQSQSIYDYPVSKNQCLYEDFRITLVQSSFQCVVCADNTTHYVFEGECVERQLNENCADTAESYAINKDRCSICNEGYYRNDYNYCSQIPIEGCLIYDKEEKICIKCQTPRKLHYWQNDHNQIESECALIDQTEKLPPYFYLSYMQTCSLESQCKNEKFVNLDGLLDQFFSCHKCSDVTKIPFASVQGGIDFTRYPTALQNFDLEQALTNKILNQDEGGKLSECLEPSSSTFNIDFNNFPSNCALGMINSEKKANAGNANLNYQSLDSLSIFCVACKSGYKPRRNKTFPLQIEECQMIQNCESSVDDQFVDKCYKCQQGYVFGYNEEGIDYTKCIDWSEKMPNCYAASENQCMICEKGYYLNRDNICVTVQSHFCGESTFFEYHPTRENLQVRLYQNSKGSGCTSCDTDELAYFIEKDHYTCAYSNTMQDQKQKSQESQYPNGCKIFGMVNNQMLCRQCYGAFVMTRDYNCVAKQLLSNCQIAIDEQLCQKCINTHIVVNYKCKLREIENCDTYEQNPLLLNQICLKCKNGYYLQDNVCLKGQVKNCEIFDFEGRCIKCMNRYGIIQLKNNEQRCVQNLKDPKCLEYDIKWLQEGYFVCKKCENTMPQSICSTIPVINECIKYDVQKLFINSSLRCLECEKMFYSTGLECVQRQNIDVNCIQFDMNKDQCEKCKDEFYLNDQMTSCIEIPEGVPGCFEYINQNECKTCNRQLYLKDNKCVPIPAERLISNCKIYKNSKECMICEEFYFLVQNKCFKQKDPNCLEHLNQDVCMKCKENFVLTQKVKDGNEQVICLEPEKIEGCLQVSYQDLNQCEICTKDLYQVEGICQAVKEEDIVENCDIYDINSNCQQCIDNFVLTSENGKQICQQNFNVNGCQSFIKENPFCVLCKNGYYINGEGQCTKQDDTDISGCMYYNKLNKTCTACYPGYIHNKQQQCVLDITPESVQLLRANFLRTFSIIIMTLFLFN